MSIVGAGPANTIIDGTAVNGLRFVQNFTGTFSLSNVTVQNFTVSDYGGVLYGGGSPAMFNNVFLKNDHSGTWGGAIYTAGPTTVSNSTFYNNSSGAGGAIYLDLNNEPLIVTNSTFLGNSAGSGGNTIHVASGGGAGTATLINVTILGDTAPGSQASHTGNPNVSAGGAITIQSSIVAYNSGSNCSGTFNSLGFNLSDDSSCGATATQKTDVQLALASQGLANNGGQTPTVALGSGSAAIDFVATSACPPPNTDQTGVTRPQGTSCDSGAFEFEATPPTSQTITFNQPPNVAVNASPFSIASYASASSGLAVQFASNTTSVCTAGGSNGATITVLTTGTCSIQAYQPGNGTYEGAMPVTQTFAVEQVQTITFGTLSNVTIGVAPFGISATASSGLTVSFASTTTGVCTVSGTTVTIVAVGTCSITASQAGNGTYAAATPVMQSFTVSTNSQTITFDAIPNQIFGVSPFPLAAQSSALLPVSFTSTTTAVCRIADDLVMLLSTGSCSINATQAGNADYSAATTVTKSFTVSEAVASGILTPATNTPFATGTHPLASATGDFNGDGIPDLVVTVVSPSGFVDVLLGDGTGGFTPSSGSPFAVAVQPQYVAVGDFNGDGKLDLATTSTDADNVTVLLGDGTGGFSQATGSPFTVGSVPGSVVVADFNDDGIQDLATANTGSNNITVLLGNGTGGFSPSTGSPFAAGSGPVGIATADFNGDGIPDLVSANNGDNDITVLLGNGSGGFSAASGSPFAAGSGPLFIVAADFNGDGKPDIAVGNRSGNTVTVLLGNGSGSFTAATGSPFAVGNQPYGLKAGDFNGDGIPDLAVANENDNTITLLLGNGTGGFSAAGGSPFAAGSTPTSLAVADFNGDGIEDVAIPDINGNNVTVLLGALAPTTSLLSTTSELVIPVGQSVPLSLAVSDNSTAFNALTGSATFKDGLTTLGTASQTGSPYSFNASSLALGSHSLTAIYGGGSGSATSTSNTIEIQVETAQTISFGSLSNQTYSASPLGISATASSGLTVSFSSTTTGVCTVTGDSVTFVGLGTCSITANQAGNGTYAPATPVMQSFVVTQNASIVTLISSLNPSAFGQGVTLTASLTPSAATGHGDIQGRVRDTGRRTGNAERRRRRTDSFHALRRHALPDGCIQRRYERYSRHFFGPD